MEELGKVQQKVSCIFETEVLKEQSSKRSFQPFKVVASENIRSEAISDDISIAKATEKLDGTCCYIAEFRGKPWLWARLDRKPNKAADKRFKKFQTQKTQWEQDGKQGVQPQFDWDVLKDFKEVPDNWIPALGVTKAEGHPLPDSNGHIPGWVPVDLKSRQHVWHLSSVDLVTGLALVIRQETCGSKELVIELLPLSQMLGCTAELIGTNVNANPYGLGTKKCPLHLLVVHGSIGLPNPPSQRLDSVKEWFQTSDEGGVEGIVWHCSNGALYKIHRHHLNLSWPLKNSDVNPSFSQRSVKINVDALKYEINEDDKKAPLLILSHLNGQCCENLSKLSDLCESMQCTEDTR